MSTPLRELLPSMRQVHLDSVERELDRMWREHNASVAGPGSHGITRNSILTLVVYTQTLEQATRALRIAHALSTQHSSRTIILTADPRVDANNVESYVGATVSVDGTSFGEDILIVSHGEATRHLPGVVLPFIVSGLPAFLWWVGEPPWGSELFEALVDGCDRLILDTSGLADIPAGLTAIADLMRRKKSRCAVSDTGWTCQTPWREIVAQFFDPAEARQYLDGIEQISIEYAAGEEDAPANPAEAYLFAGWLVSRLGWRIQHLPSDRSVASSHLTAYAGANRAVSVEINPRYGVPQQAWWDNGTPVAAGVHDAQDGHQEAPVLAVRRGALMSVHISARIGGGPRATFTMARERDLGHATTLCQLPDGSMPPSQTVHLQSIGEEAPLAQQLQRLGHDTIFEEAVTAASQLAGSHARRRWS